MSFLFFSVNKRSEDAIQTFSLSNSAHRKPLVLHSLSSKAKKCRCLLDAEGSRVSERGMLREGRRKEKLEPNQPRERQAWRLKVKQKKTHPSRANAVPFAVPSVGVVPAGGRVRGVVSALHFKRKKERERESERGKRRSCSLPLRSRRKKERKQRVRLSERLSSFFEKNVSEG